MNSDELDVRARLARLARALRSELVLLGYDRADVARMSIRQLEAAKARALAQLMAAPTPH